MYGSRRTEEKGNSQAKREKVDLPSKITMACTERKSMQTLEWTKKNEKGKNALLEVQAKAMTFTGMVRSLRRKRLVSSRLKGKRL